MSKLVIFLLAYPSFIFSDQEKALLTSPGKMDLCLEAILVIMEHLYSYGALAA